MFSSASVFIGLALCAYLLSKKLSEIKADIAERAYEDLLHSTALEYVKAVGRAEQWLQTYSDMKHVGGLYRVHAFDIVDDKLAYAFSEDEESAIKDRAGFGLVSRDMNVQRRITYNLAAMSFESTEFNHDAYDSLKKLAQRCSEADAGDRHLLTWWRYYHKNEDRWFKISSEERMKMLQGDNA